MAPAEGGQVIGQTAALDEQGLARALALSVDPHRPPAEVSGYVIERSLGAGAYGSVWLALERNTGKHVAIKFYSHRRGLDWSLLSREVEKLAVLYTCRDIIGLLSVGWEADPPYYVMEYLENGSLARLLEGGALPVARAERIFTAVAHALMHAHQNGILHCDVKPANVLLDADFSPRLADFGQARLSHEQHPALGTLFYMAPEQADLEALPDARWDVYALGALMYQTLCGEVPHHSPEAERQIQTSETLTERLEAYRRVVRHSPRPQRHRHVRGVDHALIEIIDRCLEIDPARRFPDGKAVFAALQQRAWRRSRRASEMLTFLGPGLVILAFAPIFALLVRSTVNTAERNLQARALESDVVTARILAYSLQDELEQRKRTLVEISQDPRVRGLASAATLPHDDPRRRELEALLAHGKQEIEKVRRSLNVTLDSSWFMTDARGVQRWRDPPMRNSLDKPYADRDYFHGRGLDYKAGDQPAPSPIRAPHVSIPFRSDAHGRLLVALSVPIWDETGERVLGVLGRTVELGQLLTDYKRYVHRDLQEEIDRALVLVDLRTGAILDHPAMTPGRLERLSAEQLAELRVPAPVLERLRELPKLVEQRAEIHDLDRDTHYLDPMATIDADTDANFGGPWLAAFWPVDKTQWVAIVQEHKSDTLGPVRIIERNFAFFAAGALALYCGVVAALWFLALPRLTRRDAPPPGG